MFVMIANRRSASASTGCGLLTRSWCGGASSAAPSTRLTDGHGHVVKNVLS